MRFLGYELRKANDPGVAARSQLRDTNPQGPLTSAFSNWIFRKIDPKFYEVLREAIPMNDTAINKLISLNGRIEIIGEKPDCVAELEDFCRFVPVGPVQHGIDEYRKALWGEGFEQGLGYGELVATKDLKDIEGLRVADSKYIIFWKNAAGEPEPWYLYPDTDRSANRPLIDPSELIGRIVNARYGQTLNYQQQDMVKLTPGNKFYLAPMIENSNPYGISLFRSQPWVAQILATLQNSMKNAADRFGDPMYHAHSSGKVSVDKINALIESLTTQLTNAITIKRQGGSADIVTAGGENSRVDIKIVGHEGQLFPYEIPLRHAEESIVAASGLPAWLLGKYWSTTERMAQLEVEVVLADAAMRNTNETPGLIRLFSAVLAMRGKKWKTITTSLDKPGDWGFRFISPNLHNEVAQAQAEFLRAQAEMMRRGSAGASAATVRNQGTEVPVGGAAAGVITIKSQEMDIQVPLRPHLQGEGKGGDGAIPQSTIRNPQSKCSCGASHSELVAKELSRPIPWPKLDEYEQQYERELKYDWNDLKSKVFNVLGLKLPEETGVRSQEPGGKDVNSAFRTPHSALTKAPFAFDDAQRQRIMDALRDYLGWYEPGADDSTIAWYYGQAYSLGLIQAANLMGKERPLLDLIKNREIFDELAAKGFDLVKNNATIAITDRIIPAMEQGMTDGVNPRDVAGTLSKLFDDKNDDWERLARTEMAGAAERAKLDEWEARGVDVSNAVEVPVHPRCRCSTTVKDDGNGNFTAVFAPAPDACPWCLSLQEGDKAA